MKSGQNICSGPSPWPSPLIWTQFKRTATFFREAFPNRFPPKRLFCHLDVSYISFKLPGWQNLIEHLETNGLEYIYYCQVTSSTLFEKEDLVVRLVELLVSVSDVDLKLGIGRQDKWKFSPIGSIRRQVNWLIVLHQREGCVNSFSFCSHPQCNVWKSESKQKYPKVAKMNCCHGGI